MSTPASLGELVIVAYKARDLPNREIVGKQDPFVLFRLGENTRKTKTDFRGGQHPLWDDQVTLPVPPRYKTIIVQVFDEDSKREDLISEGEIDITKVLEDGEIDDWFPLQYKGRPAGKIYLELTFYSAAPPPKRQPTRYGTRHQKKPSDAPPVPSGGYQSYNSSGHPDSAINHPSQYPPPQPSFYQPGYPPAPTPSIGHSSGYPPAPTPSIGHSSGYPPAPTPVASHSSGHLPPPHPGYPSNLPHTYSPAPSASGYPPAPTSSNSHLTGYQPAQGSHASTGYPPFSENTPSMNNAYPPASTPHHNHSTGYPPAPPNSQSTGFAANPTPSNGKPASYTGSQTESHKPDSPPSSGATASLLSSSYNPGQLPSNSQGYPPNHGYPPHNNRANYPGHFPGQGFPEPQQYPSPLGTPFAAHQGSFYPPNQGSQPSSGYPPQQGYPPMGYPPNHGYPPQQGYPPNSGRPPY